MKYAGRECSIDLRCHEHVAKVLDGAGTARGHERYVTTRTKRGQLLDIVPSLDAVTSHAIEDDLPGAARLNLASPRQRIPPAVAHAIGIARELKYTIAERREPAIDPHDDALRAEAGTQGIDELWIREGRGVHGDLLRSRIQHGFSIGYRPDASRDAEGDIEYARDAPHPGKVHGPAFRACRDVVEHELIRAVVAITNCALQDVPDDLVIAETHTLYDCAVAHVETGNDALGKNALNSSRLMRASSKALPQTVAATPVAESADKSSPSRTPPEACHASFGN